MLCPWSFCTVVVGGSETHLLSPSDAAASESCTHVDLILIIKAFFPLVEYSVNFGDPLFVFFKSRLITIGPGTSYCLAHLSQSPILPSNLQEIQDKNQEFQKVGV